MMKPEVGRTYEYPGGATLTVSHVVTAERLWVGTSKVPTTTGGFFQYPGQMQHTYETLYLAESGFAYVKERGALVRAPRFDLDPAKCR